MVNPQLELAFDQIGPTDWRAFEQYATESLVDSFTNIVSMASLSGDGGRDAEIYGDQPGSPTKFQYSVTKYWDSKIRDTLKTLRENFPETSRLIYCTSQEIGARGDGLREFSYSEYAVTLDIYDRNWFIERESQSPARRAAASELIDTFVRPLLEERKIIKGISTPLSPHDNKVALLQLALNESDRTKNQSLTKTSFDSLVSAALVGTSADGPLKMDAICDAVSGMLPAADKVQIAGLTKSALSRLTKKGGPVKYIKSDDVYHTSFDAQKSSEEHNAQFILEQKALEGDIIEALHTLSAVEDEVSSGFERDASLVRNALEGALVHSGEAFANAIIGDAGDVNHMGELLESSVDDLNGRLSVTRDVAKRALVEVISRPSARGRAYLERLLDAYTLFAFLQQTPDVQRAMSGVFDGGQIWLDTSVVLPIIAESAHDGDDSKPYTRLLRAAADSGIEFYITGGVIEEIDRHLENCIRYSQSRSAWKGRIPFIYSAYMLSGRSEYGLLEWIADFKGEYRPEQDIVESLYEIIPIEKRDLLDLSDPAPSELRGAVQSLMYDSQERRRRGRGSGLSAVDRLVAHDVENIVGIIQLRRTNNTSPFGYESWWLTLDRTARSLQSWLRDQLGADAPHSPAVTPDFFAQMLRFGPLRRSSAGANAPILPFAFDARNMERVPSELLEVARETRKKYENLKERRIRREVRDALDKARFATRETTFAEDESLDDQYE